MDNAAYAVYFGSIMPYFEGFTVKVLELFEDARENKVVLRASSTASTPIGPYSNEVGQINNARSRFSFITEIVLGDSPIRDRPGRMNLKRPIH
jgi:hypothetical protein